jgi:SAM-dependent methyltransferase
MESASRNTRRFDLSHEELQRVEAARQVPLTPRALARIAIRRPRLVREALRSAARAVRDAVGKDHALLWVADIERVRQVVPDAAMGVGWQGVGGFVDTLLPYVGPRSRVLEIGCGAGRVSRVVAPHVGSLVCSDIADVLLEEAEFSLAGLPNVELQRVDGFTLDEFGDRSFDAAFAHDVFVQLEANPTLALLDSARRKLRPGGVLVASFLTIDRPDWLARQVDVVRESAARGRFGASAPQPYTAEQVDRLFEGAGFELAGRHYPEPDTPGGRSHYVVIGRVPRVAPSEARRCRRPADGPPPQGT